MTVRELIRFLNSIDNKDMIVSVWDTYETLTCEMDVVTITEDDCGRTTLVLGHNYEEENYEPDDSMDEVGFNPYEGCYNYDC